MTHAARRGAQRMTVSHWNSRAELKTRICPCNERCPYSAKPSKLSLPVGAALRVNMQALLRRTLFPPQSTGDDVHKSLHSVFVVPHLFRFSCVSFRDVMVL